jgi:Na+:H+ antiporter, NhaA family
VFNHLLTFLIFLLIGVEIRDGLSHVKAAILPTIAALGGMVLPASLFILISSDNSAWAVVMPTDVALALGALSILGKRVNPAVKLFLLTLAVADDFFSLIVIAIFFRSDLDLASAFYTIGAAVIGALLPRADIFKKYLEPLVSYLVIPIYIFINLFMHINVATFGTNLSLSILASRLLGKVVGITLTTYLLVRFSKLRLPDSLRISEVVGIGFLCGMGMTVSLVIAEITIKSDQTLNQIRSGLFITAIISGLLGLIWLRRFPVAK